ncbi:MAG TPA: single-stranded-DNA-specific exonuclease RecJ [Coriobacteriia bacterium]|nr:single-stranded-DNA-specific exonuclease RecJ [Coriobacteriia bacterium]
MTQPCPQTPWTLAPADAGEVASLASSTGLSSVVARVLAVRGIRDEEQVRSFLSPSLDRDWLHPAVIPGMRGAAERVAAAIRSGERILVFGDFDLDGVSAAAVATRGLRAMGGTVDVMVPHRFREGYGLSQAAIERAMEFQPSLLVTVDCGISSAEETAELKRRGVDVVITDHHEPSGSVPAEVPVADPKLAEGCASRDLAGAGVALKLVEAVGELVGERDVWRSLTDLATLGTIADIVPLVAENRALVTDGIARMRTAPRPCIAALAAIANVAPPALSSDTVAYFLAPRLNAAGRMADSAVALDLLMADDPFAAEELARTLDELNRVRQSVEAELSEAAEALAKRIYHGERVLVLAGDGWHEGVKGIVASRMTHRYGVPSFLFSIEDDIARGSGRSVGKVDLFAAVSSCASVLTRFGGHEAAVGVTLPASDLECFRELMLEHLDALPDEQFEVTSFVDAEVALDDVSIELGTELKQLEPFGHSNPKPRLAVNGVFMNGRQRVGRGMEHLKFTAFDGAASVPAIAFRCRDIEELVEHEAQVDIAFELEVDEWRGRVRAQMLVRDVARHDLPGADSPSAALVEDLFARADELLAREEYAGIEDAPGFHTKLAGVSFEGRQDVLAKLTGGTALRLERQPDNPYDANACALFEPSGAQVGFLNRRLAAVLAPAIDSGVEYDVAVTEVTGGGDGQALGVNVYLERRDAAAAQVDEAARAREAREELAALPADELEVELVRRFIGERSLHGAQVEALAHLEAGRNTLAVMATGRGKSLIFHLHAARIALREGRASVFVYPLRALVADQAFHLAESFASVGLTVRTVTGETSQTERDEAFAALKAGELDCVLTTPEFLHFHANRFAATGRVGFVVVDEAHHVGLSRAGHRPAYARLGDACRLIGEPQVLAVTATASDDVTIQIRDLLGIQAFVLDPTVRDNLAVADARSNADKDAYVAKLVAEGGKCVIYVNSRERSVQIARMLRKRVPELAFASAFYNGGLSRSVRHAVERAFRNGEIRVVVATSAFGEGVNIPDIRNVVLYHLPFNEVEFNQMSGRAGRDGATARIHLLYGERDGRLNETILSSLAPSREDLAVLYRVLRELAKEHGPGFEITNAELAERCRGWERSFSLDDRGVSSGVGIFRDLGLVTGEGHGAYRRLTVPASEGKVELAQSVRYAEGLDEIAEFGEFKRWALQATPDDLLARFNRPILPSADLAPSN